MSVQREKTITGKREMQLDLRESAAFLSFKEAFIQSESHLIPLTFTPMSSLSALTINVEGLDHKLRWGWGGGTRGPVQHSMLGHLCRLGPVSTPLACFYKARVVESLSPVKERGEKMRGNTRGGGEKS